MNKNLQQTTRHKAIHKVRRNPPQFFALAVCVTGLVVVDTKSTFTLFGQIVILCLIQIGGWGFMSFGVFIALVLRKNIGFNERSLVKESFNQYSNDCCFCDCSSKPVFSLQK